MGNRPTAFTPEERRAKHLARVRKHQKSRKELTKKRMERRAAAKKEERRASILQSELRSLAARDNSSPPLPEPSPGDKSPGPEALGLCLSEEAE